MKNLNHYWRIFGTGLSFSVFGLGGLLIGLLAFPLLMLRYRQPEERQLQAQRLIHRTFGFFVGFMQWVGIMRGLEVQGLDKLLASRGELIVANHPSLIDVVCLISLLPKADCIVKTALWSNPFTRGPVQAAGYILNDGSPALVERCVSRLQAGHSLLIFPEGTRTEPGQRLNTFQRGAANIAARSGAAFRPVILRCVPTTLTKKEKWYQVPPRPFHISVEVHDALPVTDIIQAAGNPSVAARHINNMLYEFFDQEISRHERAGT